MPQVTKDEALELLTNQVQEKFGADELLEIYNEIFPDHPYPEKEAMKDPQPLIEQIVDYIKGLEIEEIIDRWGLIFPRQRRVWYNEVEDRIHYNEEAEAVPTE